MNSRYNVLHVWQWKISLGLDISRCWYNFICIKAIARCKPSTVFMNNFMIETTFLINPEHIIVPHDCLFKLLNPL